MSLRLRVQIVAAFRRLGRALNDTATHCFLVNRKIHSKQVICYLKKIIRAQ